MTPPALAASRFAYGLLLGAGLGLVYGWLRPLQQKRPHLTDLFFLGLTCYSWLYLSFAICRGQLRFAYTAALALGAVAWEMTVGKWLRPVWGGFWHRIGRIFHFFALPVEKFLNFFRFFSKKLLAILKKWVTIKGTIRRSGKNTGGARHGTRQKKKISFRVAQKPSSDLGLHLGGSDGFGSGVDHPAGQRGRQQRTV